MMDPKTTVLIALLVGISGADGKQTGKVYGDDGIVIEIRLIYFSIRYTTTHSKLYKTFWKEIEKYRF